MELKHTGCFLSKKVCILAKSIMIWKYTVNFMDVNKVKKERYYYKKIIS